MAKKDKYKELKESAIDLSDFMDNEKMVSTGSLMFDWFLGGGYRSGLYRFGGDAERGKTAQALTWAANWLLAHENGEVVYFDAESRITPTKLNASPLVDVKDFEKRVSFYRYNIYEEIGELMFELVRDNVENKRYFFVIDSLDMLLSKKDLSYDLSEDEKVASIAKISKRLMRRSGPFLRHNGHHLMLLSQITANINTNNSRGPATKSDSGGHSLRHCTDLWGEIGNLWSDDIIWEFPEASKKEEKGRILGHYFRVKFSKTPNDKTGQTIRIPIRRAINQSKSGVWRSREVVDLMLMFKIIKRNGAWFELLSDYHEELSQVEDKVTKWQGAKNLYTFFDENEEVTEIFANMLKRVMLD